MSLDISNPFGDGPVLDYSAIESLEDFRRTVEDAGVIAVIDKSGSESCGIMYGVAVLRAIASGILPPQRNCPIVVFGVDMLSLELEHLAAATTVVKGLHEWGAQ